jgi:hypothetical protein
VRVSQRDLAGCPKMVALLNRAEKIDLVLDEAPDLVEGSTVRDAI